MWHSTKIKRLKDILICAFALASISMPYNLQSQTVQPEKEWVVVIDAGHGGKDPGAIGSKVFEKKINLAVALKTGSYISNNLKNVKVIYTRDDDTFIGLAERAEIANRNKADLFISIHANSLPGTSAIGAETFIFGPSNSEANLRIAMKENSVITFEDNYEAKYEGYDPNSTESFIIFSLMQNTYQKQSTEFASLVQDQFRDRVGRRDRGVKQNGLIVLWRATMPSVLIELGFLTNTSEEKFLISEQGQDYLASAIFRAFRDYKQIIDSRSDNKIENTVADKREPVNVAGKTEIIATEKNKTNTPVPPVPKEQLSTTEQAKPAVTKTVSSTAMAPADDIYFMVQISAMPGNSEMNNEQLKGIEQITKLDEGDRVRYAAGKFAVYDDATEYRRTLTARFPDAFVIAVKNGNVIPLKEAVKTKTKK